MDAGKMTNGLKDEKGSSNWLIYITTDYQSKK